MIYALFPQKKFGLGSRLRKLFRFLDVWVQSDWAYSYKGVFWGERMGLMTSVGTIGHWQAHP